MTPLKVMIFIDGTWLYYSIYEREHYRDVIAQRLGRTWRTDYAIDWNKLPLVACQALMEDKRSSWTSIAPPSSTVGGTPTKMTRPIEISRVSVYSSMHRETSYGSARYRMFSDMMSAGFDVNMMETVGRNEKCVDIQLAVDMLYYATVPEAYDVALLLTGDRDFLPAIIRCRQKGRKIGLISLRSGATLAFTDTPNLKDFDTIWLEDYLSEWICKKTTETISSYVLNRVLSQFIIKSGHPRVSSRDIGRYLKMLQVNGKRLLDEIKDSYGGLFQFLIVSEIYQVESDSRGRQRRGPFWVSLKQDGGGSGKFIAKDLADEKLSDDELNFLNGLDQLPEEPREKTYHCTINDADPNPEEITGGRGALTKDPLEAESDSMDEGLEDFSIRTVPELREICRKKGLAVSGRKAELVERIQSYDTGQREKNGTKKGISVERRLENIILEYLRAKGGAASSRRVAQYLAANSASKERQEVMGQIGRKVTALAELKEIYGSLNAFVEKSPHFYERRDKGQQDVYICISKESAKTLEEVEESVRQQS
jgi:hypothetical protein